MNTKRILKIVAIIVIVIVILLITYFIIMHFNGFLNKNDVMNRAEVIELLEKGKEYPNYYYSSSDKLIIFFTIDKNKTEYYIKDNIVKCVNNDELLSWKDYNNNEVIEIWSRDNGQKYASINTLEKDDENISSQMEYDYSLISEEETFNTDFEYMGSREYEGRNVILVKVWNKDNLKINSTIFYIDKDTGLIMRRIDYTMMGFIKVDSNRNVKFDSVTDNDVQRPNLDGYEILESK